MAPEYFYPLLGVVMALGWGVLSTTRWWVKAQLKAKELEAGGGGERLALLEERVAELEERLDFTERALAASQARPGLEGRS